MPNDPFVEAVNALMSLVTKHRKTIPKARFKSDASKMDYLQRLSSKAGIRSACEGQLLEILRHKMRRTCKTYMTLTDYALAVMKTISWTNSHSRQAKRWL